MREIAVVSADERTCAPVGAGLFLGLAADEALLAARFWVDLGAASLRLVWRTRRVPLTAVLLGVWMSAAAAGGFLLARNSRAVSREIVERLVPERNTAPGRTNRIGGKGRT
jgi:UDP-N-acetylmuramyl pentapeptide synthase